MRDKPGEVGKRTERQSSSSANRSWLTPQRGEKVRSSSPIEVEIISEALGGKEVYGFKNVPPLEKRERSASIEEPDPKRRKVYEGREEHISQLDAAHEERHRALGERGKTPSIHSSDLVSDYSEDMDSVDFSDNIFYHEVLTEINPIDSSKDKGGPGPTTQAYRQEIRKREAKKQEEEMKEKEILNSRFELELNSIDYYIEKFGFYREEDKSIWEKAKEDINMRERDYDEIIQDIEEIKKTAKTNYFELNKEEFEASVEKLIDSSRICQLLENAYADRYFLVEGKKEGKKARKEYIGYLEHMYGERLKPMEDRGKSPSLPDLLNRHISNFMDYAQNKGEVLNAALKAVGMDRETLRGTVDNIVNIVRSASQQISEDDIEILRATNMQFDEIEKAVKSASGGDNPLQHETERLNRHISNFMDYAQNKGEVLDAALKALGTDWETLRGIVDNIKSASQQISEDNIETLRATNMQFDEIEKAVKSASGGDNPLQHETERLNRHFDNFMDYAQNKGEVLDAALKALGTDWETLRGIVDNIRSASQQISKNDIETLRAINMQFDKIEEEIRQLDQSLQRTTRPPSELPTSSDDYSKLRSVEDAVKEASPENQELFKNKKVIAAYTENLRKSYYTQYRTEISIDYAIDTADFFHRQKSVVKDMQKYIEHAARLVHDYNTGLNSFYYNKESFQIERIDPANAKGREELSQLKFNEQGDLSTADNTKIKVSTIVSQKGNPYKWILSLRSDELQFAPDTPMQQSGYVNFLDLGEDTFRKAAKRESEEEAKGITIVPETMKEVKNGKKIKDSVSFFKAEAEFTEVKATDTATNPKKFSETKGIWILDVEKLIRENEFHLDYKPEEDRVKIKQAILQMAFKAKVIGKPPQEQDFSPRGRQYLQLSYNVDHLVDCIEECIPQFYG